MNKISGDYDSSEYHKEVQEDYYPIEYTKRSQYDPVSIRKYSNPYPNSEDELEPKKKGFITDGRVAFFFLVLVPALVGLAGYIYSGHPPLVVGWILMTYSFYGIIMFFGLAACLGDMRS